MAVDRSISRFFSDKDFSKKNIVWKQISKSTRNTNVLKILGNLRRNVLNVIISAWLLNRRNNNFFWRIKKKIFTKNFFFLYISNCFRLSKISIWLLSQSVTFCNSCFVRKSIAFSLTLKWADNFSKIFHMERLILLS
jgi:hypothetical protein